MSQLPFHLLELNIISAQDLALVSRNLKSFAVTWVSPERKLRTKIDRKGHVNPSWNDKFVFRVDNKFLESDSSSVMIEIYAMGWLRDIQVGSVRVLVSDLIPHTIREHNNSSNRRVVALQIRRPSGRPQGILNMGVMLLDNTMRSMPIYNELSVATVGYRDLMDGKAYKYKLQHNKDDKKTSGDQKDGEQYKGKKVETVKLWRSRSDRTNLNSMQKYVNRTGSVCNGSICNNGASLLNGGSVVNGSMVNGSEVGVPMISDLGPSPSVVAAAVARGLYPTQLPFPDKAGSSILGDWTVEESSVEGLKTKIDRWRMELPPMYARNNYQGRNSGKSTPRSTPRRRSASAGPGVFSCFGNAYGCEFTIVCGGNESKKRLNSSDSSTLLDSDLDSDRPRR